MIMLAIAMAAVRFTDFIVTVPPKHQLFQQEEQHDAAQQRHGDSLDVPPHFHRFGQHLQQRGAKQRTNRVTDQHRHPVGPG